MKKVLKTLGVIVGIGAVAGVAYGVYNAVRNGLWDDDLYDDWGDDDWDDDDWDDWDDEEEMDCSECHHQCCHASGEPDEEQEETKSKAVSIEIQ